MTNFRTTGFLAKPKNPMYSVGKKTRTVSARAALVTAAMANNDTVELAGPLTFDERVVSVFTPNASPALTSSVANLGFFYKDANGNLVKITATSDVALWSATSVLATAQSTRDLLRSINAALDTTKNIGQLLVLGSDAEPSGGVFLALTFTTKPSVDGVLDVEVMIEEATTN